jgi:hypothetical protein
MNLEEAAMWIVLERLQDDRARAVETALAAWQARGGFAEELAEVLLECVALADTARRRWETTERRLHESGVSTDPETGALGLATLRRILALLDQAARAQAPVDNPDACPELVRATAELRRAAAEAPAWSARALAFWEWAGRPFGEFDRKQIKRSRLAFEQGEYEDVADILARVQAGGPLVKGDPL